MDAEKRRFLVKKEKISVYLRKSASKRRDLEGRADFAIALDKNTLVVADFLALIYYEMCINCRTHHFRGDSVEITTMLPRTIVRLQL